LVRRRWCFARRKDAGADGRFLEEPDRALRQEAWESVAKRRLQDEDKCDEIFDELVKLRTQIGQECGL